MGRCADRQAGLKEWSVSHCRGLSLAADLLRGHSMLNDLDSRSRNEMLSSSSRAQVG